MLMPQMHKKMMTATNLLSELAHALRRSIGENGDQETSNKQNTKEPLQNSMEKSQEVSINSCYFIVIEWVCTRNPSHFSTDSRFRVSDLTLPFHSNPFKKTYHYFFVLFFLDILEIRGCQRVKQRVGLY